MNRYSLITLLVIVSALVAEVANKPVEGILNWDVTGYYMYWPSAVIYDDFTLQDRAWAEKLREKYDLSGTLYQFHKPEGRENFVNQYTSGMAILYTPAFWIGHWMAGWWHYPQDGFSRPYQNAMVCWSLLIAIAGMAALRKLLLYFFSDPWVAVLLIATVFATNYYIQITKGLATPHNYLFLLYALFLICIIEWHRKYHWKYALSIAFSYGMMCLIRPTEIVAMFIPLFWGVTSVQELTLKMRDVWSRHRKQLFLVLGIVVLCALPQLIYWKLSAGKWVYMSYSNHGEGLDLLSPHTVNFLFSYRKGWFIYTPLALFAMLGWWHLWKKQRKYFWSLAVFFFLNLYLVSSWSNWWYAQCFSQRAMVHTLPVTILLLGWALIWCGEQRIRRWVGFSLASFMALLTLFFSWQYEQGILDQWRMTKDYFWAVFLRTTPVDEATKDLLLVPRDFSGAQVMHKPETYHTVHRETYSSRFEDRLIWWADSAERCKVEVIRASDPYSKALQRKYKDWTDKDHIWLRGYADVFIPSGHSPGDVLLVAAADHKGPYGYRTFEMPDSSFRPGSWNRLPFLYLSPEIRIPKDNLGVYIWYRGQDSVLLRDIYVESLEKVR